MNTFTQRNFAAGEITPDIYPKADLVKYSTGAKTVRNMIVMRHGGLCNRAGTRFMHETKFPDKKSILIPYIHTTSDVFMLEVGAGYFRVFKNGAPMYFATKSVTAIALGATTVITSAAHGFINGNEVHFSGITGPIALNERPFVVANVTTNTFEIKLKDGTAVNSSAMPAYVSGGLAKVLFEGVLPYTEAQLFELRYKALDTSLAITHRDHFTYKIFRFSDTLWQANTTSFGFSFLLPGFGGVSWTAGAGGSISTQYAVTAVLENGEETQAALSAIGTHSTPAPTAPNSVTWTAPTGITVREYNIYRTVNGIFGFLGISKSTTFSDIGVSPNVSDTPPVSPAFGTFAATNDRPAGISTYQQRTILFSSNNFPHRMWGSKIGYPENFSAKVPPESGDAFNFTLTGSASQNEIRHVIDLGTMVIFTASGEWIAAGDSNGAITPNGGPNWRQHSYYGSSNVTPIVMGGNAIYVQAQGSIVRDFGFDYQIDGYRGNDLTVFSAHLFKKNTIVAWAYQQVPHSIVWAVRDDGILIGLTYLREHDILGWHRHDTDGFVEHVAAVPEGTETAIYITVRRTINGVVKRLVERMTNREEHKLIDLVLSDSTSSYDGRNKTGTTVSISGGTLWDDMETLTLTASTSTFTAADVGNSIFVEKNNIQVRFQILGYTSGTVVTGKVQMTVPLDMRSAPTTLWSKAIKVIDGLWHLEGKKVSVFADEYVVASPNNPAYDVITVTNGRITLPAPRAVIHVGLPVTADVETLNIELPQAETLANKKSNTSSVVVHVNETRGIWAGTEAPTGTNALEGLNEVKPRSNEKYDTPNNLMNGPKEINIGGNWQNAGRVFIRQVDPLPCSILAVAPSGLFPLKGM